MAGRYLLGIDLGTSACKASVLDPQRGPLGTGRAGYSIISPAPRWAELEPMEVLSAVHLAVRAALESSRVAVENLRAVGFDGLVPSLIPVGENGQPLARCMLNLDRRATAEAEQLNLDVGAAELAKITGKATHPKFPASKILWLRRHRPEVYERAAAFLQIKDFVELHLTGRTCTDPHLAANTLLFDVRARQWSPLLLEYCGIGAHRMPEIVPPTAILGEVTPGAAEWSGLAPGTPVVCGLNDQTSAVIGSRAYRPGGAFENSGTSTHLMVVSDRPSPPTLDQIARFESGPGWRPGTFTYSYINHATGALLGWLRDQFWHDARIPFSALDSAAESVPPGAAGLFLLPFVEGSGSPDIDPRARGVVFGLALHHDRRHFVRAFLEGVAYRLRDAVEDLRGLQTAPAEIVVGGGAARSRLWRQIKADVTGLPVTLVNVVEAASVGAALLAGEGVGVFEDALVAADRLIEVAERCEPSPEASHLYDASYRVYQRLCRDLKPSFGALAEVGNIQ